MGFLHGDPHPGNLLKVTEGPHAGKLALLDFGLVAEIPLADRCSLDPACCPRSHQARASIALFRGCVVDEVCCVRVGVVDMECRS